MSCILIQTSLQKAMNSNGHLVEVQYIIWSRRRKKDGTTGVCWAKWHGCRTDAQSKNLTRMRNIPPKCNKRVTNKQQTRFSLTSIN
jgi:hypothetical protein